MTAARAAFTPRRPAAPPSVWAAAAVLALVPCATMSGQQQESAVQSGARVRITAPCSFTAGDCRFEGSLARIGADTITLTVFGSPVHRSLSTVRRLEVSRGRRSHRLLGAGLGFVVGAGVTYVVLRSGGSTALCNQSANQDAIGTRECIALAALGGAAGAGLGALAGGMIKSERWEDVPIERLRVGLWRPPGSAVGLAAAVAF